MRHRAILGLWFAVAACNAESAVEPTPLNPPVLPPAPPPTPVPPAPIFRLAGIVLTDEGRPLPAARVQMVDPHDRVFETTTNLSGYFEFGVEAGGVRLLVTSEGYNAGFHAVQV